jgi:hypothetical protein
MCACGRIWRREGVVLDVAPCSSLQQLLPTRVPCTGSVEAAAMHRVSLLAAVIMRRATHAALYPLSPPLQAV